ncbi:MAG: YbaN family protein [Bacteroidales bacterium]|nr:YbaN family protein [Bacteroidales bacterium]
MLGIPLPLLPTTPFLLLSAWLYARSSKRFYFWLINHRYFGKTIRNYREKGGVALNIKIWAIALLWITITLSATLAVGNWWVRVLLLVIAIGVTIHISSLKTIKPNR